MLGNISQNFPVQADFFYLELIDELAVAQPVFSDSRIEFDLPKLSGDAFLGSPVSVRVRARF